jgi:hypothetical protein
MLFKIGNEIVDTEVTPVGLIFVDKDEAKVVGNILSNIKNGNTQMTPEEIEGNGNWWFMCPAEWTFEERDKWSSLTDEQKELLKNRVRVSGKLDFEL